MNKMRFVSYYRVSTDRQDNGIPAQRAAVTRYLASLDCEHIGEFEERESGKRNDRPELARAIALAKQSKAVLVIAKLDRLSRNASFLLQLQDSGIDFIACDMPNADKTMVGIMAIFAQREREMISTRVKESLAIVRKTKKLGNPNPAKAWKKAVVSIKAQKREFAATAIKSIREIQSTGVETLARIADCMNKRGEKTPRGGTWTATAVKRVLECAA